MFKKRLQFITKAGTELLIYMKRQNLKPPNIRSILHIGIVSLVPDPMHHEEITHLGHKQGFMTIARVTSQKQTPREFSLTSLWFCLCV